MVGATIVAVMMGSYASVAFAPLPTTPKASWTIDPLVISFTATNLVASGSATDSLACTPSAEFVQLLAKSSNPAKISLSTSPLGLSCGSIPTSVTITATCRVPSAQCKGSYTGQVQVRQPSNYRNLSGALKVLITVT